MPNGASTACDESNRKHYCKLLLALIYNSDLVTMQYILVFIHLSSKFTRVLVRVLKRGDSRAEDARCLPRSGRQREQTLESRGVSSLKRLEEKVYGNGFVSSFAKPTRA